MKCKKSMTKIHLISLIFLLSALCLGTVTAYASTSFDGIMRYTYTTGAFSSKEGGTVRWTSGNAEFNGDADWLIRTLLVDGSGSLPDFAPEYCSSYGWREVAPWNKDTGGFILYTSRIDVGEGITSVGTYNFCSMNNLTEVYLPSGLTSIGEGAFSGCTKLSKVCIPESVTSIAPDAFRLSPSDLVIYCKSGSYANSYALANGMKVYLTDKSECDNNGHRPGTAATCTSPQLCTVCGVELAQAMGHNYTAATCEAPQKCTRCGATKGEALGHTWGDWKTLTAATTVSPEKQYRQCTVCGEKETRTYGEKLSAAKKVTGIRISGTSSQLLAGKKMTLEAVVSPTNASNKNVTWSSSNTAYASVSDSGVVTAKAAGAGKTVTITAQAQDGSGKQASYQINIKGAVKKITLKASKKTVKAGKKLTIKATVKVGTGGSKALTWSSSNKKYATVSSKGVVTAKKAGKGKTVTITAKAKDGSGKKATIKIKIK